MPGYVMHLAMAEEFFRHFKIDNEEYKNLFRLGCVAPDVKNKDDKKMSHFWTDENFEEFCRAPELSDFLAKYKDRLDEPYVAGYYAHLLLDRRYMDWYWKKHFTFYNKNLEEEKGYDEVQFVKLNRKNRIYMRDLFFSDMFYYGDYDRINSYIIQKYKVEPIELDGLEEVAGIDELELSDHKKTLFDMNDNIRSNKKSSSKSDDFKEQSLKVLDLNDIEALISETVFLTKETIC